MNDLNVEIEDLAVKGTYLLVDAEFTFDEVPGDDHPTSMHPETGRITYTSFGTVAELGELVSARVFSERQDTFVAASPRLLAYLKKHWDVDGSKGEWVEEQATKQLN